MTKSAELGSASWGGCRTGFRKFSLWVAQARQARKRQFVYPKHSERCLSDRAAKLGTLCVVVPIHLVHDFSRNLQAVYLTSRELEVKLRDDVQMPLKCHENDKMAILSVMTEIVAVTAQIKC